MADYFKPRGTADILPDAALQWQYVEEMVQKVFATYHYREIRTPIFEHTEVFERGVGDTTDIVQKEMYTFLDRGDRSITLRPEGTAGVVRAFVEQKLYGGPLPAKLYYFGPMFRYETPQAGRTRQFHQYGVEVIGSDDPRVDAEVIELADHFLRAVGVTSTTLELNSVGCPVCRVAHKDALVAHLLPIKDELCEDCQSRIVRNPLRILDCKIDAHHPVVESSPMITDHLCDDCAAHFAAVRNYLDLLEVPYVVNKKLVRGLDYYTKTAFEFVEGSIGAQSTILAGGRYNGLVKSLGGPDVPGIGFAGGIERLLLALAANGVSHEVPDEVEVYVMALSNEAHAMSVNILRDLRVVGVVADADYTGRGLKAQMKTADRLNAKVAVLIGEDEVKSGQLAVRDLSTREQILVAQGDTVAKILNILQS